MAGWYRQGTVALTPGSAAVAGTGTMWTGVVRPGSAFTIDGRTLYEIREVANDQTLTLDRPWEGETASSSAYAVIAASATLSNAELAGEIAAMVAKWAVREDQYDDWLGGSPNGGPNGNGKYPLTDSKGVTRLVENPARLLQLLDDGVVEHAAQIVAAIEDDVATARQAAIDATAAIAAVGIDRQAVSQAATTVAVQSGESTAAAATATAQAAIATQRAGEAAGSAAAAAEYELSVTTALSTVETTRNIVLEAQAEADTAATAALSSRTAAEAARDIAAGARDTALEARDAAKTAQTQAQDWAVKTDAPVSGSLKSALSYALEAASQATAAIGKAQEAAGSAAAAATSAADLDSATANAQAAAGSATTGAQTATAKAAAATLSADIARSAAQEAETAGAGSATARAAAEAARDTAATAMTAAQVAATQAGQSQTNAANSAQTAATAAADAISAKSDATTARDLAAAARTEAQGYSLMAQAWAVNPHGTQVPSAPGYYSSLHWAEEARQYKEQAAAIVGGNSFGLIGDGVAQRIVAGSPSSMINLMGTDQGVDLVYSQSTLSVAFKANASKIAIAASGALASTNVAAAIAELEQLIANLSQDTIQQGGGSVHVTEDGTVEIAPAAGKTATYNGNELHTSASAYSKAQVDAAIATSRTQTKFDDESGITAGYSLLPYVDDDYWVSGLEVIQEDPAGNGFGVALKVGDTVIYQNSVGFGSGAQAVVGAAGELVLSSRMDNVSIGTSASGKIIDLGANTVVRTGYSLKVGANDVLTTASSLDVAKLTGTIDIARLPAGALERLYPVTNDAERFALTTAQVQKGDTVQVGGTSGPMYLVIDESNLGNSAGYRAYSASRAAAVDWSGIENKPSTVSGYGIADAYTKTQIDNTFSTLYSITRGSSHVAIDADGSITIQAGAGLITHYSAADAAVETFTSTYNLYANTATINDAVIWTAEAGKHPTTISGYGITDAQTKNALLTAISALDSSNGVLVQTGLGAASKRAIGAASSTDIPDRAAADTRYAPLASPALTGKVTMMTSGQNVGINTTSPGAELEIADASGDNDVRINLRASSTKVGQLGRSTTGMFIDTISSEPFQFFIGGTETVRVPPVTSAVNRIELVGSATGQPVVIRPNGSDANATLLLASRGTGAVDLQTNNGATRQALVTHTPNASNWLTFTGSNGGSPTVGTSGGNLDLTSATGVVTVGGAAVLKSGSVTATDIYTAVKAVITQGSNITVIPNDAAKTLTVASAVVDRATIHAALFSN